MIKAALGRFCQMKLDTTNINKRESRKILEENASVSAHLTDNLQRRADAALADESLQQALSVIGQGFMKKRQKALDKCPDFKNLSNQAVAIKNHTLAHIRHYLTEYETALTKAGGTLHYARTPEEARTLITQIARQANAKTIVKGKTMVVFGTR